MRRITRPNAQFQIWEALLHNRNKRQRAGEFVVQGVRPITLAIEYGWQVRAVLYDADRSLSRWALDVLERLPTGHVAMAPELLGQLSGKDEEVPELLLVVGLPEDDFARIAVNEGEQPFLGVVFDRPTTPGNIGTIARSVDAFGGQALIITGHSADPYDPKAVRASTGSLFAVPVLRAASHRVVIEWVEQQRDAGTPISVVGTDEEGSAEIAEAKLTGPTLLVIGNETHGLSSGWREACDSVVRIPIGGAASSLNAASAATVALYEAARQRG